MAAAGDNAWVALHASVQLVESGGRVTLRWPSGDLAALIRVGPDEFIDRNYWEEIHVERDQFGRPAALVYDEFRGQAVSNE